jgi:hypothetical protein
MIRFGFGNWNKKKLWFAGCLGLGRDNSRTKRNDKFYALVKGNDGAGKELAVKLGPDSSTSTLAQIGMP